MYKKSKIQVRGNYSIKFRVIPYVILISGIILTFVQWYSFKGLYFQHDLTPLVSIAISGLSVTLFIFALLLLYNKSYDWAVTMTEATTRQLKQNAQELTNKVYIIEEKNKKLEEAKKTMIELMHDLNSEKNTIAKENVKMEALLESIGDGMIVFDKAGRIEMINYATESLLGFKADELIGKDFFETIITQDENEQIMPRESRPVYKALYNGQKTTSSLFHPLFFVRRDGNKFAATVVVTPVIVKKKIEGAIMVFSDISKELDVDRSKTEFVSLASHQLRTPLSTIGWYAEMLLDGDAGKLTSEQHQFVEEIYNGNRRMVELVNSLLNVSRIELGKLTIDSELTDFVSICESVVKELSSTIKLKDLKLVKQYDESLSLISADPKLVRIIFQNLLTNAIKYTPEKGKIVIEISKKEEDVFIKVEDTGYGIPELQKCKIFSRLFRADNAKEKQTEGTGLGLYIVKLVVDSAKGKIWFDSKENKGTSFFVTIPLSGMAKKEGTKSLIEEKEFVLA